MIKARVTAKSPVRTWANARGEGKLFSVDLIDESGEIRATAFKEQCDKFYDMIEVTWRNIVIILASYIHMSLIYSPECSLQVNQVYLISRCVLKTANKKFTNLKNDYEMSFTSDTQVIPCHEDTSDIPTLTFSFIPISTLAGLENNAIVG